MHNNTISPGHSIQGEPGQTIKEDNMRIQITELDGRKRKFPPAVVRRTVGMTDEQILNQSIASRMRSIYKSEFMSFEIDSKASLDPSVERVGDLVHFSRRAMTVRGRIKIAIIQD